MIFDTNAFIAWMRRDTALAESLHEERAPVLTLISLGELHHGVRHSARIERNMQVLQAALKEVEILLPDRSTALLYGDICSQTRRKGRPIPSNDAWIAAMALQYGMPLLTRDQHFTVIDGLNAISW